MYRGRGRGGSRQTPRPSSSKAKRSLWTLVFKSFEAKLANQEFGEEELTESRAKPNVWEREVNCAGGDESPSVDPSDNVQSDVTKTTTEKREDATETDSLALQDRVTEAEQVENQSAATTHRDPDVDDTRVKISQLRTKETMTTQRKTGCFYHDRKRRSQLEYTVNILAKHGLPMDCARKFARAACICDDELTFSQAQRGQVQITTDDAEDFGFFNRFLSSEGNDNCSQFLDECAQALKPLIRNLLCGGPIGLDEGKLKLLQQLKIILSCDVNRLLLLNANKSSEKLIPMSVEKTFHLNLQSKYVQFLIGQHGRYLKPFCKKYNCAVHIYRYVGAVVSQVVQVIVKAPTQTLVDAAETKMHAMATSVREKREIHEKKVSAFNDFRRGRNTSQWDQKRLARKKRASARAYDVNDDWENGKGQTDKVGRGVMPKWSATRRKGETPAPLVESRCLNCITPLKGGRLKESGDKCTYHPGFIKYVVMHNKYVWSCCDMKAADRQPTQQQHKESGCTTGQHNYRPTKFSPVRKSPKKPKKIGKDKTDTLWYQDIEGVW